MKTPVKVSMKVQRIAGALCRVSIQNVNHLQVYFCGIRSSLISFWQGTCNILNRKYHVPVYFLRNVISLSLIYRPGKKYHVYRKKNTTFPDSTRKIISQRDPFWKDHLFRTFEENIIFPCIFFRKIIFHFPSGGKIIFSGKRNIIFPNYARKIIFQRDFFGKTIFSGRLEKENVVFRTV